MKYLLVIIACCSFLMPIGAQDKPSKRKGRVELGLYYNPSFTYRMLAGTTENGQYLKDQRNQQEVFGFSQAAGATVAYRIGFRFRIELGVLYGDRSYRTKKQTLQWPDNTDKAPTTAYLSFHHYYGDMPLKIKYELLQTEKINLFVGLGATVSLFGEYNRNTHIREGTTWRTSNKDKNYFVELDVLNFFAIVDAGLEYQLSPAFKLSVALSGQLPLKAANANLELREYFYSVGVGIGLIYTPLVLIK